MLPDILDVSGEEEPQVFEILYTYFKRDFVDNDTYLAHIYVDPDNQGMRDGKQETFWHITTRDVQKRIKQGNRFVTVKTRPFDPDRGSRIEWVKKILVNHAHDDIRLFYHKETKGKKHIRLYLWAHESDFVVIVQKLGQSDCYLVTSFYITEQYKRDTYQNRYQAYLAGGIEELVGCEWF